MSLEDFPGVVVGGWGKAGNTAKLSPAGAGAWLSLAIDGEVVGALGGDAVILILS